MNGYVEDIDSFLEGIESDEFEERTRRRRPPVRTPSRQTSFVPRSTPTPATQGQVQAATRTIDSKIETLSNAVKALEARSTGLSASQDRLGAALNKEVAERKKVIDGTRADIQQTKMLSAILPLVTQTTADATDNTTGKSVKVLTRSDNQLASLLPLLLLMSPGAGAGDGKGPLGGDNTMMLMMLVLLSGNR